MGNCYILVQSRNNPSTKIHWNLVAYNMIQKSTSDSNVANTLPATAETLRVLMTSSHPDLVLDHQQILTDWSLPLGQTTHQMSSKSVLAFTIFLLIVKQTLIKSKCDITFRLMPESSSKYYRLTFVPIKQIGYIYLHYYLKHCEGYSNWPHALHC